MNDTLTVRMAQRGLVKRHSGKFTSLEIISGHPAISYYDNTDRNLLYVRAKDATGTSWGTPVEVDAGGNNGSDNVGWYTSLAVVDGHPAIGYYDVTNLDLRYALADNPTAVRLQALEGRADRQGSEPKLLYLAAACLLGLLSLLRLAQLRSGNW